MGLISAIKEHHAHRVEDRANRQAAEYHQMQGEIEFAERQMWPDEWTQQIATRYQRVLGVDHIRESKPKDYLKYLPVGYFNPIPASWANNPSSPLVQQTPLSKFDDAAEERLYWVLNHGVHSHLPKQAFMKPDRASEMRMAHARMRRAAPIDPRYQSRFDAFQAQFGRRGYSVQVPPQPLHQEFVELGGTHPGGVGVDTMIMIDVSGSMGFNHATSGFEQPRHIDVVHSILGRAVHHTTPRDHYHGTQAAGVETVLFSSYATYVGKINVDNFPFMWNKIEGSVGGGTQVMSGWQKIKQMHFEKHGPASGARYHPTYGWQAGENMVKLSLLVLLDGEADDMDEWELELLGETWAYVTILLIGRDGCPHHHRHANELERVARANSHIQFFDCQGRMAERLILHDVLQAVYPAEPPTDAEILDPKYDHPPPAYSAYSAQSAGYNLGQNAYHPGGQNTYSPGPGQNTGYANNYNDQGSTYASSTYSPGQQNQGYQNTGYENAGYQSYQHNSGYQQNSGYAQNSGYQPPSAQPNYPNPGFPIAGNQNTGYQNGGYQRAGFKN